MQVLNPTTEAELGEMVAAAHAADAPLEIAGQGSKADWGRAVALPTRLCLAGLAGIRDYAPAELVLTAGAGTSLRDIRRAVASEGQHLAFEPPDLGPLFGKAPDDSTIGGVIATNLSGSRRPFAGAARDFFLGFRAVNGRGELFKAGGKVVKNVTGYDLPKLLAGSFGTLGAMAEVTLKIVPAPETSLSLVLIGQDLVAAQAAMTAALGSNADPTGAVYLPDGMAGHHPSLAGHVGAGSATVLRLEGSAASIAYRRGELERICAGPSMYLDHHESTAFWIECGALQALLPMRDAAIWLLSVPPAGGADVVLALRRLLPDCRYMMDWGGGRIWLAVPGTAPDAHGSAIRGVLVDGGHATLIRAGQQQRGGDHVFQPEAPIDLLRRLRRSFDPKCLFNRGRLHSEL
ncbi:glycolate oxidase FAD binding subunit [Dongia mobilis]|uniref:Glycolate oxidase FAD binding subunit n=1 Tax=Dongia mobilis TaxID=578943 RepID=A0A4R6WWL0_9PROT|nr:FAD-binding protein [Dongia mobilis]TDQ84600.1 glycolate oxidase FAD binding subunit [Dongia mobilis]